MNATLDTIFSRRTIRSYKREQLKDQDIEIILKAAIAAPSGNNLQGWHFTVVQNKELIADFEAACTKGIMMHGTEKAKARVMDADYKNFYATPTLIVISTDKQAPKPLDVSAAAQNILLAAWSLGIGSCYLASPRYAFMTEQGDSLHKRLGIPAGYEHCVTVGLGYIEGSVPAMPARRSDVVNWVR